MGTGVDISVRNTLISHELYELYESHALHESKVSRMSQISHESYVFAAPEVAIGGIATLVQDGDEIELDITARLSAEGVGRGRDPAADYKASA